MLFAGQIKEEKKVEFEYIQGVPTVKGALANVVCKVHSSQVAGDHTLFIGEVQDIVLQDGTPLTFFEGKYGRLAEEQLI